MLERLQKIISAAGVTSRRAAEEMIAEGRVRVNGKVVTELGSRADPSKDHIKVDGKLINPQQPPTYIILNKPAGFVTTMSDPEGRPTVQDLLKGIKTRVYPVGRLDYNTEGLLLLTNDGDFAHLITHPKHEFPKTYLAKVKGVLTDAQIGMLEKGMFLQDGKTAPAKVKKVRKEEMNSWLEITIHEGRKRQVRRMFDHVGNSVIKLKRIKTGSLLLGDLPEGRFRYLTAEEVNALRETALKTDDHGRQVKVYKPREKSKEQPGTGEARRKKPEIAAMSDTRIGIRKNQTAEAKKYRPRISDTDRAGRESFGKRESAGRGSFSRPAPKRVSSGTAGGRGEAGSGYGSGSSGPARRTGSGPRPDKSAYGRGRESGVGSSFTRSAPKRASSGTAGSRGEARSSGYGSRSTGQGRRTGSGPRPDKSAYGRGRESGVGGSFTRSAPKRASSGTAGGRGEARSSGYGPGSTGPARRTGSGSRYDKGASGRSRGAGGSRPAYGKGVRGTGRRKPQR